MEGTRSRRGRRGVLPARTVLPWTSPKQEAVLGRRVLEAPALSGWSTVATLTVTCPGPHSSIHSKIHMRPAPTADEALFWALHSLTCAETQVPALGEVTLTTGETVNNTHKKQLSDSMCQKATHDVKREGCEAGRGGLGCGQQMPGVGHRWLDPTEEVRPEQTLRIRTKQLSCGMNAQGSQTHLLKGSPGGCTAHVRRTAVIWLQLGKRTWGAWGQKRSRWPAAGSQKPRQDTAGF